MKPKKNTDDANDLINDDSNSNINDNKFWKWLNKEKKRLTIIATIVGSIGIIYTYTSPVISEVAQNLKTHSIDTLSLKSKKHDDVLNKLLKTLNKDSLTIDSLKEASNLYRYHLLLINDIIYGQLDNISINGVNFKKSKSGKLYYSVNGVLYGVILNNNSYYYVDYKGKYYPCL